MSKKINNKETNKEDNLYPDGGLLHILSTAGAGASSGLALGSAVPGIGNIAGTIIGTAGGAIKGIIDNKNAREQEAALLAEQEALERQDAYDTNRIIDLQNELNYLGLKANMNAYGGKLFSDGGYFTNGVTEVNAGGTHGENQYGGVFMGIGANGIPNQVEEGEVVYNNYVYSNRLHIPNQLKAKYKFKGNTFANAAREAQEYSEERPNDPIAKRELNEIMAILAQEQEAVRNKKEQTQKTNVFATGSKMTTMETSPYRYEENLLNYNNKGIDFDALHNPKSSYSRSRQFILDNWDTPYVQKFIKEQLKPTVETINKSRGYNTPFDITREEYEKGSIDRHYGGIYEATSKFLLPLLNKQSSPLKTIGTEGIIEGIDKELADLNNSIVNDSEPLINGINGNIHINNPNKKDLSGLRGISILNPIIGMMAESKGPDYTLADHIEELATDRRKRLIPSEHLSNYAKYEPEDFRYAENQAMGNLAATQEAIDNRANGNAATAMAGYVSSMAKANDILGDIRRQGIERNYSRLKDVNNINNNIDRFNIANDKEVNIYNNNVRNSADDLMLKSYMERFNADDRHRGNVLGNIGEVFNTLENIALQDTNYNMAKNNPYFEDAWKHIFGKAKNGGKLTKLKRI